MHALFRDAIESFHLFKKLTDKRTNSRCVRRYNETFKCTKGRAACEVSLVTRKNCQYCRYQKCLAAGMRPSWILSGQQCTQLEISMSMYHNKKKYLQTRSACGGSTGAPADWACPARRR